jgi:hypothetical protein
MKAKMFEQLLASVREGAAILRGQSKPSRRVVIECEGPSKLGTEPAASDRTGVRTAKDHGLRSTNRR